MRTGVGYELISADRTCPASHFAGRSRSPVHGSNMMLKQRLSAHIGYLLTELPFPERVAAAAEAGFTAVEHPQPFGVEADQMFLDLKLHGMVFSQIAAGTGDPVKGEKGLAALPGREGEFRDSFHQSLEYALRVGCPLIHPMAGVPGRIDPAEAKRTYLKNVDYAVEQTSGLPVKVLIEAISHAAVPGYYMSKLDDAVIVQDIYGPGNVSLLVDTFHAAANGVDLIPWVAANAYRIGHVHIADHPGRHEPGTGQFPFEQFLQALVTEEYEGAIGFEYIPRTDTNSGLGFLRAWKQHPASSIAAPGFDITARGQI